MSAVEVEAVAQAAVEAGLTVGELSDKAVRARLVEAASSRLAGPRAWSRVRDRLAHVTALKAGRLARRCRSCEAPVVWATVEGSRRRMPVDPLPHPAGNVQVVRRDDGSLSAVVYRHEGERPDGPLYRSHLATCPKAEKHRAARLTPVPDDGPRCSVCRLPMIPCGDGATTHPCCDPAHQAYLEGDPLCGA